MTDTFQTASILFLDIDGVLNKFECANPWYDHIALPLVAPDVPLNMECITNLKHIVSDIPDLKIVWSTSWAVYDQEKHNGWINPRLYLESQPWFSDRLVGRTPRKMSSERHDEIILWLEGNLRGYDECLPDVKVRNFAAIDDIEYGMHLLGKHYFKTTHDMGLSKKITDDIIDFLKTDLEWTSLAS